jgi:transcriptional antiterminator
MKVYVLASVFFISYRCLITKIPYICIMKHSSKNTIQLDKSNMNDEILHSMISSFKIENIVITESVAQRIHEKVKSKLKK